MDPEVSKCLQELPTIGKTMYSKFVKERIEDCTTPVSDVIPKAKIYTFLHPPPVNLDKGADKLASCKASAAIVTQMFVSLQARPDENMGEFFMHEIREIHHHYPIKASCVLALSLKLLDVCLVYLHVEGIQQSNKLQ